MDAVSSKPFNPLVDEKFGDNRLKLQVRPSCTAAHVFVKSEIHLLLSGTLNKKNLLDSMSKL